MGGVHLFCVSDTYTPRHTGSPTGKHRGANWVYSEPLAPAHLPTTVHMFPLVSNTQRHILRPDHAGTKTGGSNHAVISQRYKETHAEAPRAWTRVSHLHKGLTDLQTHSQGAVSFAQFLP